jgi:hypothetical protein
MVPLCVSCAAYHLTLEYLENEFYQLGLDSGVIPAAGEKKSVYANRCTKQIM